MEMLENKTDQELIATMIAEIAKAQNELNCAKRDIEKALSRQQFVLVLQNTLKHRHQD